MDALVESRGLNQREKHGQLSEVPQALCPPAPFSPQGSAEIAWRGEGGGEGTTELCDHRGQLGTFKDGQGQHRGPYGDGLGLSGTTGDGQGQHGGSYRMENRHMRSFTTIPYHPRSLGDCWRGSNGLFPLAHDHLR